MAKELPYFKFEPSKWDNGNIQLCSFEAQGMFINLCCIYWSRIGDLPLKLAEQKLFKSNADAYAELMQEEIFAVNEGKIVINFLDEQLSNFGGLSETKSKAAKVRWDKVRENQQVNADALHMKSKSNAIREDKIKEDKIRENEISFKKETKSILNKNIDFDFSKCSNEFKEYFLNEFIQAPKQKKKSKELQKKILIDLQNYDEPFAMELMKKAVLNNWQGYKFDKTDEQYADYLRKKQNGNIPQWQNGSTTGIQGPARKQSFHVTPSTLLAQMQAGEEDN